MLTRQKELLQWMISGALTASVIGGAAWYIERDQPARTPASHSEKEKVLHSKKTFADVDSQGKGAGHLSISFASSTDGVLPGSLNLSATILSAMDLSDLNYEWLLPDGVTIVKGSASGKIGNLDEGSQALIEASFNIPSAENKRVHLQVYRLVDGERVGQVVQYNTLDQKSIDREMASKRETLESVNERSPASQKPKIME